VFLCDPPLSFIKRTTSGFHYLGKRFTDTGSKVNSQVSFMFFKIKKVVKEWVIEKYDGAV
jgi:hypothetical protein